MTREPCWRGGDSLGLSTSVRLPESPWLPQLRGVERGVISSSLLAVRAAASAAARASCPDSNWTRRFATEPEFCLGTSLGVLLRSIARGESVDGGPEENLCCVATTAPPEAEPVVVSGSDTRGMLVGVTVEAVTGYVEAVSAV